ncbi:type 1 glutamine amidotransferase domain-containing protein [Lysinibacillus fusiformis]|uniref:type 1 glutamine amidotransferase domain-containing protein n=1 Tax=Lysinibacillus sp. PWR01 TaxID=3342384 RepID=UPI00372D114B
MKKILVVLTNTTHYENYNEATGLWLGEATEFVEEVLKAGYTVDYVSPKGGFVPLDPRSMKYANDSDFSIYDSEDFRKRALSNSLNPNQICSEEYKSIYYTGGHGVMWDFPKDENLQKIAMKIYNSGGYIATVCHGIAGLLELKDDSGNYLIKGKNITGFTTTEECLAGKKNKVPYFSEKVAQERGAYFNKKRAYSEFAIQDGRIITGQNPFSVKAVANLLINAMNQ